MLQYSLTLLLFFIQVYYAKGEESIFGNYKWFGLIFIVAVFYFNFKKKVKK